VCNLDSSVVTKGIGVWVPIINLMLLVIYTMLIVSASSCTYYGPQKAMLEMISSLSVGGMSKVFMLFSVNIIVI